MRIAYDATTLRPSKTGIGYYTEHLLRHLLKAAPECEFHLLSNREVETSLALDGGAAVIEKGRLPIRNLWMQMVAPRIVAAIRPDVAHFTNSIAPLRKNAPTVLTVHDMSLVLLPGYHPLRRRLFRPLQSAALRGADAVITVSEASKLEILRLSGIPEERLHVIHEAASPVFRPILEREALEEVRARHNLPDRFILFVGTLEPRKNLKRLIEAFALLKRRHRVPHRLVLAGMFGWGYREVRRAIRDEGLGGEVRLCGYFPFLDLPCLYNLAEVFVFPSLHEGFGLPLLEAMSCGTAAVTSSDKALMEVAGEAAVPVDPRSVPSLADGIWSLIECPEKRRHFSAAGLARARRFSWESAARRTLEVYRWAIANGRGG